MLTCSVTGRPLVPFFPSRKCPINQLTAVMGRIAVKMEDPVRSRARHFMDFTKILIQELWPNTVSAEDIKSQQMWLQNANYPGGRKRQLRGIMDEMSKFDLREFRHVDAFVKHENYPKRKTPRGIFTPSDKSKCYLAALCHAIDKKTFAIKYFMKGKDPKEWPDYLQEMLGDVPVRGTDFTSFEAHHSGVMCYVTYFWMMHMIRKLPNAKLFKELVCVLMKGDHDIEMPTLRATVHQRLLSGAQWTSSANGVLNLCIMMYLASEKIRNIREMVTWCLTHFRGVVEGDDGLCEMYEWDEKAKTELGIQLKPTDSNHWSEACFCGVLCTRDDRKIIKDPVTTLEKLLIFDPKYLHAKDTTVLALARAKALSLMHNYKNCPIIAHACRAVLKRTRSINANLDVLDERSRGFAIQAQKDKIWLEELDIPDGSRELMTRFFKFPNGLPIYLEDQLAYERAFDEAMDGNFSIDLTAFETKDRFEHADNYYQTDDVEFEMKKEPHPRILQIIKDGKLEPDPHHVEAVKLRKRHANALDRKFAVVPIRESCEWTTSPV